MQFFGFFSILFGIIVIAYPEFLAYLIGFFFLFMGINILLASFAFRRPGQGSNSWKFGGYEITRRNNSK